MSSKSIGQKINSTIPTIPIPTIPIPATMGFWVWIKNLDHPKCHSVAIFHTTTLGGSVVLCNLHWLMVYPKINWIHFLFLRNLEIILISNLGKEMLWEITCRGCWSVDHLKQLMVSFIRETKENMHDGEKYPITHLISKDSPHSFNFRPNVW